MVMEWAGIIGSGKEAKFIKYFQNTYHGKYLVPAGNSGSNGSKNKFTEEEYAQFVEKSNPLSIVKREGCCDSDSCHCIKLSRYFVFIASRYGLFE